MNMNRDIVGTYMAGSFQHAFVRISTQGRGNQQGELAHADGSKSEDSIYLRYEHAVRIDRRAAMMDGRSLESTE